MFHVHFYDPETRIGGVSVADEDGMKFYMVRANPQGDPVEWLFIYALPDARMAGAAYNRTPLPLHPLEYKEKRT